MRTDVKFQIDFDTDSGYSDGERFW